MSVWSPVLPLIVCGCLIRGVTGEALAEHQVPTGVFAARDTLRPAAEDSPDAKRCLETLVWTPTDFQVEVQRPQQDGPDAIVRFPSPSPSGPAHNDLVALEWYAPKSAAGELLKAPAVVVVHESGSQMDVGRIIAKALYAKGFHAFLIHLPYYGLRKSEDFELKVGSQLIPVLQQGIADVRRARDAVAVLPPVRSDLIALQGTSLGGFVAATAAGLDNGFDKVFIMVAGGNLFQVINQGGREAAQLRRQLEAAGYAGEALRELASAIEPTRLAHRLRPHRTWMYTAQDDQVVPRECAIALQQAAQLPDDHHIVMWGDHYTAILFLPVIIEHMKSRLQEYSDHAE